MLKSEWSAQLEIQEPEVPSLLHEIGKYLWIVKY